MSAWIRIADGFAQRYGFGAFAIGTNGYCICGMYGPTKYCDKYDAVADAWSRIADFGGDEGVARKEITSVGFSIGNKGYIGTGCDSGCNVWYDDFWEYNSGSDSWTQRADFPGGNRAACVGFELNGKGYIGCGYRYRYSAQPGLKKDFWEYDPGADSWSGPIIPPESFVPRPRACRFVIDNEAYIIGGRWYGTYRDVWKFNGSGFSRLSDHPTGIWAATGCSVGGKGYLLGGFPLGSATVWEYTPSTDTWQQLENFPYPVSGNCFGLQNRVYAGGGLYQESYQWYYYGVPIPKVGASALPIFAKMLL
ncbi:MAG: hypothetical protein WA977_02355 [Halobacteriota archaeon]